MSITFKNIPHGIATFFKAVGTEFKKLPSQLEKVSGVIEDVEKSKPEVEALSDVAAVATGNPAAVAAVNVVEDAAYAALGAIDAALKAGGAAAEQKLLDAGVDQGAIAAAKAAGTASVAVYTALSAAAAK